MGEKLRLIFGGTDMEFSKGMIKRITLWITYAIVLFWGLNHPEVIGGALSKVFSVLMPFIVGAAIAFILNAVLKQIEELIGKKFLRLKKSTLRVISVILTYFCLFALLALVLNLVIPELISSFSVMAVNIQSFLNENISKPNMEEFGKWFDLFDIDPQKLIEKVPEFVQQIGNGLMSSTASAVNSIVSVVVNLLVGTIFSVYVLMSKETLSRQSKKIVYALISEKKAAQFFDFVSLVNKTFSNFLSGQLLEIMILGSMFAVSMTLLGLPYAVLIGILIAFTALIPIVGAWVGCIIGVILIMMVNPMQTLEFVILFVVLQQIEGNLIYPRVVGSKVGLAPMWVMVAVTIGGNLFGILGMLLFIPTCSVIYVLISRFVNKRLKEKNITITR